MRKPHQNHHSTSKQQVLFFLLFYHKKDKLNKIFQFEKKSFHS